MVMSPLCLSPPPPIAPTSVSSSSSNRRAIGSNANCREIVRATCVHRSEDRRWGNFSSFVDDTSSPRTLSAWCLVLGARSAHASLSIGSTANEFEARQAIRIGCGCGAARRAQIAANTIVSMLIPAHQYGRILHWLFQTECGSITDRGPSSIAAKGRVVARCGTELFDQSGTSGACGQTDRPHAETDPGIAKFNQQSPGAR
jgi:hypothetical protein